MKTGAFVNYLYIKTVNSALRRPSCIAALENSASRRRLRVGGESSTLPEK